MNDVDKAAQKLLSPGDLMYEVFRTVSGNIRGLREVARITYSEDEPIVYFRLSNSYCKLSNIKYNLEECYFYVYAADVNYSSGFGEETYSEYINLEKKWKKMSKPERSL